MATTDPFRYTNSKLDTVEAGIEVVKTKVGLVDDKIGVMADDWRIYGSKINELEDNIHYHDSKMDEFKTREEIHSAKLRKLEDELSKLKVHNTRLQDELWVMQKSPRFAIEDRDRPNYVSTNDKNDTDKRHVDFQRDQLSHRDTYRERMFGPDTENRYYTRDNERFRNADKGRQAEAKSRREAEKIELHDGNFKPWARDAYQNPSHHPPKSTNSGVYLFMRTHMDGKPDVVKALKEGRSVLANSYGQLKGIANNTEINLVEGLEGWNIRFNMTRTGDYWSERSQRTSGLDFIIIVFWFPSLNDAEKWVITERKFKNPHFPDPDGSDVVILPLNDSPPQERLAHTYIMTEYPRSFDPILFRDTFAPKIKDLLWRKFGIDGFFIQCIRSRYIWGSWIKPSSLVTTIRFNSKSEANAFFNDADYKQIRQDINRCIEQLPIHLNWFRPTTSMFTINEYV